MTEPVSPAPQWRAFYGEKGMRTYVSDGNRFIYTSKNDAEFIKDALNRAPLSETVPPKKGWPWKEGEVSIPAHILQQCEVWIGTAAHAGIQTKWFDGTDTPNRTQLLALHSALLALLNEPAAAAPSSIAAPVAWRHRTFAVDTGWGDWRHQEQKPQGPADAFFHFEPLFAAPVSAIEPRIPVGWIARKDDGANLHFSVAQGWRIEEVLTVASTDGGRKE